MTSSIVVVEQRKAVAWLWLNRPEIHNAFDEQMIAALTAALKSLDRDEQIRVVVLGGLGKSFCAGASLQWMQRMATYSEADNLRDAEALAEMLRTLNMLSKPTIARVHGPALAGGTGLVAACDIAVATPQAVFGTTEVRLGLIPATISPYVLAAMGTRAARRYFLTAEKLDAGQAQTLGLVHELCGPDELDARIEKLCSLLLAGGPQAQVAAKRLIHDLSGRQIDQALIDDTSRRIAVTRCSSEAQEGLGAFLNKRQPSWGSP
ncbi:MAG: enoyl-CoA hydratase [Nevskia sp.]|nr:enoyl-CoA hydratase [Nevskia sp.]